MFKMFKILIIATQLVYNAYKHIAKNTTTACFATWAHLVQTYRRILRNIAAFHRRFKSQIK